MIRLTALRITSVSHLYHMCNMCNVRKACNACNVLRVCNVCNVSQSFVRSSHLIANHAVMGGAVSLHDSSLDAVTATFSANRAEYGGALFLRPRSAAGSRSRPTFATLADVSLDGGGCSGSGLEGAAINGGIAYVESPEGGGEVTLRLADSHLVDGCAQVGGGVCPHATLCALKHDS